MKTRIVIYPKDIQLITGKAYNTCYKLMRRIKQKFQKSDHQVITIDEFCEFMGLKRIEVERVLGGGR